MNVVNVYILWHQACFKEFQNNGKYLRYKTTFLVIMNTNTVVMESVDKEAEKVIESFL